jgi:TRAP-type C4-dicarboxylate transport system permease small subunit
MGLKRFDEFNHQLSEKFEWVGLVGLLTVMFITFIDVIGAKLFLRPVLGAIDIVMLAQLLAIAFAAASTLLAGRHVQVEFFVMMLPKRVQVIVDGLIHIFCLVLFILIVWRLTVYGYDLQTGGEISPTAQIPLYPFAYATALAGIPVCIAYLLKIMNDIQNLRKR